MDTTPDEKPCELAAAVGLTSLSEPKKDHSQDGIASVAPGRSFPVILYEIVSDPGTDDVCGWLPHGKGFAIYDKIRFGKEILPVFFDGTKFTSFTRRLKRWSFVRVARGAELGAYYNENFLRDNPAKVLNMKYRVHGDADLRGGTNDTITGSLAMAAMLQDKKNTKGKKKPGRPSKVEDYSKVDGMLPKPFMGGMSNIGVFPSRQWSGNLFPQGNIPMNPDFMNMLHQHHMNMMPSHMNSMNMIQQQQYFNMMAQSFARNFAMNMGNMGMSNAQNTMENMPQQQLSGDMNDFQMMMNAQQQRPQYPQEQPPPQQQQMQQQQFQGESDSQLMQQYQNLQHNLSTVADPTNPAIKVEPTPHDPSVCNSQSLQQDPNQRQESIEVGDGLSPVTKVEPFFKDTSESC